MKRSFRFLVPVVTLAGGVLTAQGEAFAVVEPINPATTIAACSPELTSSATTLANREFVLESGVDSKIVAGHSSHSSHSSHGSHGSHSSHRSSSY